MTYEMMIDKTEGLIYELVNKYSLKGYDKDDLYQESIFKVYQEYEKYNNKNRITTFVYTIVDNHLKDLCRKETRQSRSNHTIDSNGLDIILKDVKGIDFDRIVIANDYSNYEYFIIDIAYSILSNHKRKFVLERVLNGETYANIGNSIGVSRQRVEQIWKQYINQVKVMINIKEEK